MLNERAIHSLAVTIRQEKIPAELGWPPAYTIENAFAKSSDR
jgi:hypothetical protein